MHALDSNIQWKMFCLIFKSQVYLMEIRDWKGFLGGSVVKNLPASVGDKGDTGLFDLWVRKIRWRSKWQLTLVFLSGESHGQRSIVGYSLWGCKESDMTEATEQACTDWKMTDFLGHSNNWSRLSGRSNWLNTAWSQGQLPKHDVTPSKKKKKKKGRPCY